MKKSRFSEAQIVGTLKELEAGSPATELGRRHGVHANTIRLWKDKYAGLESSDLARLKQLEAENAQMQRIIARQTIENRRRTDAHRKKRLGLSQRKEALRALQKSGVSQRRACFIVGQLRRTLSYRKRDVIEAPITRRVRELADERPRFGWRRLLIMVRREVPIGEFRFRRIYRELHLQVRPRKKRKVRYLRGNMVAPVSRPNERWSIDFMHDRLANSRGIRTMNVVDDFTRECLALEIDYSFASAAVIRQLNHIVDERGLPGTIRFDNGSEFTSRKMLKWGAERGVVLHFIDPGKPTQNAQIESLNGRIRDEFLNAHSFSNIYSARQLAAVWRDDYNELRPHSSLGYLTPKAFAEAYEINPPSQLSVA